MKNIIQATALFSLMILSPCHAGQMLRQHHALDGTWWLSVSDTERFGFLEGEGDCYVDEYRGTDSFTSSYETYSERLTDDYSRNPSADTRSVVDDILKMRDNSGASFVDPDAEHAGPATGLDWMQMDAVAVSNMEPVGLEQRGYVEGYLACHAELNHSKGGVFSNTIETYVNDIDRWYEYIERSGDMNPNREDTTIAKVLFMFADKSSASKLNGN